MFPQNRVLLIDKEIWMLMIEAFLIFVSCPREIGKIYA